MEKITIALASDHAGWERKQTVMQHLNKLGISYKDFGAFSDQSTDYADWAHPMSEAVENGEFTFGITLCGSGNGINMTANKHQKIRSALCWIPEIAALARQHNDANVLSLPARFITDQLAIEIVDAFLNADFEGGRHLTRINKIPLSK
ncbi:MAG: RpiB/LacA/LacB family sugar-phosphate isomerase [Bacteroidales bacterium]|nr:RpiB/LacA/LacB family sugar-phosphate isomerase [Bacteroidales bacterium]